MAILFYDDISLDGQEIQDVSLQQVANVSALNALVSYQGRIAYQVDTGTLNYFNGSAWVPLDGTGNIDSIIAGSGITVGSGGVGNVAIGIDYSGADNIILSALTATTATTNSRILVSVGESVESHALSTIKTLLNAGISSILPVTSDFITTSVDTTSGVASITATLKAGSTTPSSTKYYNGSGGWIEPEANDDTTYTLPTTATAPLGGEFILTPSTGVTSSVILVGTAGEVLVTPTTGADGTFTIGLPTNVIAPNDLTVAGTATFTNNATLSADVLVSGIMTVSGVSTFSEIPTIPGTTPQNDTDAASKGYVDDVVSGGLAYRGTYNAGNDPTILENADGSGILKGFTYVVSIGGDYGGAWSPSLAIGDMIIANTDDPASAAGFDAINRAEDLATTSVAGLCKFPSGNGFEAPDSNGAVSMKDHSGTVTPAQYGSATTTPVITTDAFGSITACSATTIQITTGQVTGFNDAVDDRINLNSFVQEFTTNGSSEYGEYSHGVGSEFVTVQVYETATGTTVYPQITREAGAVTVTFKENQTAGTVYKVLVMGNDVA